MCLGPEGEPYMGLIKKGAEANLFLEDWHGEKIIIKKRISKVYRIPPLDLEIRSSRTAFESQLLHDAKLAGVPTPIVFLVDLVGTSIVMQYVGGVQVKQVLNNMAKRDRIKLCRQIGKMIGRLHKKGIVHGDLTTSNMILTSNGKVYFIDFGLGDHSESLESRGVDLHLMKRALQSTHYKFIKECFEAVMQGYAAEVGSNNAAVVANRIQEIERRGRYVESR